MRMRNKFGKRSMVKKFKEVKLSKWTEVEGSKITLKDAIQFPVQLIRIALNYNFKPAIKQNPLKLLSQSYRVVRSFLF